MSKKSKKEKQFATGPVGSASVGGATVATGSGGDLVLGAHAVETPEPTAERRPFPMLLITLTLLLLYFVDLYVLDHGADVGDKKNGAFPAQVYDPFYTFSQVQEVNPVNSNDVWRVEGPKVFNLVCVACHQGTGQGVPGQFPPLVGSEWVLEEGPNRIIRIVLHGLMGPVDVKGSHFDNAMLPWKDMLNDMQVASVLSYVRNEWGNKAPLVTADQVQKIRDAEQGRAANWTAAELLKIPAKD